MGIILNDGTRDLGYRLDCERLFEAHERPENPLAWFDMDGKWFQKAKSTAVELAKDADALARATEKGQVVSSSDAYWFAPVPRPGKVICIGLNYRDHAAESNMAIPQSPVIFSKFPTCVIAPGEPVVIPPTSQQVDYEAELAVVIGRGGRRIHRDKALDHVAGYSLFNDASIRDFQLRTPQWTMGKNFDATGAFGPWLVTPDAVPPGAHGLRIQGRMNGRVMQDAGTDQLIFNVSALIEMISVAMSLEPGDVIITGTPGGVGAARKPPVFMQPGDVFEVEIEGIGVLSNPIQDE